MGKRLTETLSGWAVERRGVILVVSLLVSLAFGVQLRHLKSDSSPDALVSSVPGQAEVEAKYRHHFQPRGTELLVLLSASDVTGFEEMRAQVRLAAKIEALASVSSLQSISRLSLFAKSADREELSGSEASLPTEIERVMPLLREVAAGDPGSFPGGPRQVAMRMRAASVEPFADGARGREEHRQFRAALLGTRWVVPSLLSRDRSVTPLVVRFDEDVVFDQSSKMAALAAVREVVESSSFPKGMSVEFAGVPALRAEILRKLEKDRLTLNPAMMIVCLLILGFTFRWWAAVIAPLLAVGIAALSVVGTMASLGQPLTILTNIIPPLLIIVGLSDSVHLLGRYFEELKVSADRVLAGRRAARAMLVACFLTSLTTAVGFASLATAETPELAKFGLAAAGGVVIAYFATVLFVPAMVTKIQSPAALTSGRASRVGWLERAIFATTRSILRRAKFVAWASLLSALALAYGATLVTADARLLDAFEEGEPVTRVTRKVEEKLGGIRTLDVLLSSSDASLLEPKSIHGIEDIVEKMVEKSEVLVGLSHVNLLRAVREAATGDAKSREMEFASQEHAGALLKLSESQQSSKNQWISKDGRSARLSFQFKDVGIVATLRVIRELEDEIRRKLGPGVKFDFLGEAYTGSVGRAHVLRDLLSGLGLALVAIFVLLGVLFRSFKMAVVAIPPNVIPLLATGAYMMVRGIQLNMATVITFSIGIGLAVDDTVHVVARFREESQKISSVRVALLRAARGTGRAIVITAASLSLGFGVLLLSEFVSVRQFGELISVTVLNCLVGALVVQPALLALFFRKRAATAA